MCEIAHHSGYDLSLASACVCCAITHDRGTICYWHRRVSVQRSHITAGTICYWHRRVFVARSHITGGTICYGHRPSACVCSGSCRVATDIYIYIYMGTQTSYLSICLIDKPTSLYPMYHRKKAPKSYPRHSCCCLAKSTVIVDENSS